MGISRFTTTICTNTTSSTGTIEQLCFDTNPVARRVIEILGAKNTSSLPIHVSKQYQSGSRNARLVQINADVPVLARTRVRCSKVPQERTVPRVSGTLYPPPPHQSFEYLFYQLIIHSLFRDVALFINSFYLQFFFFFALQVHDVALFINSFYQQFVFFLPQKYLM